MSNINSNNPVLSIVNLNQLIEAFKEVEDSYDTGKSQLNWLGHKYIVIDHQGNVSTTRLAFRATNLESITQRIESTIQNRENSQDNPIEKEHYKSIAQGLTQLSQNFSLQREHSRFLFLRNTLNFNRSGYSTTQKIKNIILLSDLKAMGFNWKDPKQAEKDLFLREATWPEGWTKSEDFPDINYDQEYFYIADQEGNPRVSIFGKNVFYDRYSSINILHTPEEQARISKEWTAALEARKKNREL